MLPTRRPQSNMAQEFRGWINKHNHSPQNKSNTFKTLLVPSCTMRERMTQNFLLHSVPLQHDKPTAHEQCMSPTHQLCCHPPKCSHPIQSVRHGNVSTHSSSYLSKPGGKSRVAGRFYLTNCNSEGFNNCAILTLLTIIKQVMLSASKAELAALYYSCKLAPPLQTLRIKWSGKMFLGLTSRESLNPT